MFYWVKMAKDFIIIWSPKSELNYTKIINYIIERWTIKEAIDFDTKAMSLLNVLKTRHRLCPKSKMKNLRKCVITSQTSLIYQIHKDSIELVDFIDNRANLNF